MKRIFLEFILPLLLIWTNPSFNTDGTPCTDLSFIRLVGTREVDPITISFDLPMKTVDEEDSTIFIRSGPGLRDSSEVTVPLRARATDYWQFKVLAGDSSGNISDPSNIVRVSLTSNSTITGVGDLVGRTNAEIEWYDIQGRKIDQPKASGFYFRRIGNEVTKVLLLK